jgi:hypothetical protein
MFGDVPYHLPHDQIPGSQSSSIINTRRRCIAIVPARRGCDMPGLVSRPRHGRTYALLSLRARGFVDAYVRSDPSRQVMSCMRVQARSGPREGWKKLTCTGIWAIFKKQPHMCRRGPFQVVLGEHRKRACTLDRRSTSLCEDIVPRRL